MTYISLSWGGAEQEGKKDETETYITCPTSTQVTDRGTLEVFLSVNDRTSTV